MPNSVKTDVKVSDKSRESVKIGSLGRLVDAKDFAVLINAILLLKESGKIIELKIAGEGDERSHLESVINDLDLASSVELLGIQPAAEFLSSIDLFVMSSKREGVPVALLEAMAYGLPIATTAVGGIPEVVSNDKEALLCEPGKPQVLADTITRLIDDRELRIRLGDAARKKVVACYSDKAVVAMWENLYGNLYQGRN